MQEIASTKEPIQEPQESELVKQIFDDYESKSNLVGLFNLLLQIDKRINPQDYVASEQVKK